VNLALISNLQMTFAQEKAVQNLEDLFYLQFCNEFPTIFSSGELGVVAYVVRFLLFPKDF